MAGQNTFQISVLNDANMLGELEFLKNSKENTRKQEWKCCMDVFLRKSQFCPELTQILDLEEIEAHYGKCLKMAHS